jgi:hypothetical protein
MLGDILAWLVHFRPYYAMLKQVGLGCIMTGHVKTG